MQLLKDSIPYQFLENRNKQSCTKFSGLRNCLDSLQWLLPSVTFYLKVIYSVISLLLRIWNAFWPFEDCYLLGFVFAQFFYCVKLPCMKIHKYAFLQIKHPCFTRDLGPLHPSRRLQSPGPGLQRPWHWNVSMLDLLASEVSMKSCNWWGLAGELSSEADRAVGQSWQEPKALDSIHIRGNLEFLTQWDVVKQRAEHIGDGKPEQRFCAPETLSMRAKRAGSLRHVIQPGQEPRWWLSWVLRTKNWKAHLGSRPVSRFPHILSCSGYLHNIPQFCGLTGHSWVVFMTSCGCYQWLLGGPTWRLNQTNIQDGAPMHIATGAGG